jgi:hypothetical protein
MSGLLGELGPLSERGYFLAQLLIGHEQFAHQRLEAFVLRLQCL